MKAFVDIESGGFKSGEMVVFAGRQTGKSYYTEVLKRRIYGINLCKEIMLPLHPEPKYKFSRAKWYEADISWNHYREVMEWCTEQFGPRPKVSDAWSRWFDNHGDRVFFRDERDYNWFVLRWGA